MADVLGSVGSAVGTAIGGPIGGILGGALGGLFGKKKKGAQKTIVSIAAMPCPKVDDKGLEKAWFWADKISQAVALWATAETYKAAREDYKIAKRYHELAKEQWDLHKKYYQPLEQQELDEIWAERPYKPDYATAIVGHTRSIDTVFAAVEQHRHALSDKYCVCATSATAIKTELVRVTVYGDSDNYARRYAEKLAMEREDLRFSRKLAAAARGRGLLSESASHAHKASNSLNAYAQAMGGLASSAMQFSGYINNRNATQYNGGRERFNSRADVFDVGRHTNVQENVRQIHFNTEPTGGVTWGNSGHAFMQSGLDPTAYVTIGGSHQ